MGINHWGSPRFSHNYPLCLMWWKEGWTTGQQCSAVVWWRAADGGRKRKVGQKNTMIENKIANEISISCLYRILTLMLFSFLLSCCVRSRQ